MTLDAFFGTGIVRDLGSYTFDAEDIVAFARQYDPQPKHLGQSPTGANATPCASCWHVSAVWMKLSLAAGMAGPEADWDGPGARPVFGPSPGFRNMRWPRAVFAGDTVAFARTILGHRKLASRPGWRILTIRGQAHSLSGEQVLDFDSGVLVQVD